MPALMALPEGMRDSCTQRPWSIDGGKRSEESVDFHLLNVEIGDSMGTVYAVVQTPVWLHEARKHPSYRRPTRSALKSELRSS